MQYGLIGEHLGHSFSKEIHEKLSPCSYEIREIAREDLPRFLTERDFLGINVTIPYKETVIPWLDQISDEARAIGAVNTIVCREGRLYGYNTDYFGLAALAAKVGIGFEGRKVLILGAGGSAKMADAVARDQGAASVIHAVRHPRESGQIPLSSLGTGQDFEVLINCTPVGMFPNEEDSAVRLDHFPQLEGVLDLVYNPLRTELVLEAQSRGIPAEGGLYMLVAQAIKAREYFDGTPLSPTVADSLFEGLERAKRNLVLIGMPASGKSTIARMLSKHSGRPFVDTDELIVERAGKPIPRIFAEDGESAFRRLESEVIQALSLQNGLLISTGGGAILDPQNVRRLKRNGLLCRIDRRLDQLSPSADRPLASDLKKMQRIYESRKAAYEAATELVIDNNGPLSETLQQLEFLI